MRNPFKILSWGIYLAKSLELDSSFFILLVPAVLLGKVLWQAGWPILANIPLFDPFLFMLGIGAHMTIEISIICACRLISYTTCTGRF